LEKSEVAGRRIFLDVIQDCIIVTMCRGIEQRPTVRVGSLAHDGNDRFLGNIKLDPQGGRWELPTADVIATGVTLSEIGWTGKVGPVVPHRWQDRISKTRVASSVALLWAAAIRPDGSLDFDHMKANVDGHRVVVDTELPTSFGDRVWWCSGQRIESRSGASMRQLSTASFWKAWDRSLRKTT
jgi:adenine-specific DNA-methyltransferase